MNMKRAILEAVAAKLAEVKDVDHPDLRFITMAVRINPKTREPGGCRIDLTLDSDLPGRDYPAPSGRRDGRHAPA